MQNISQTMIDTLQPQLERIIEKKTVENLWSKFQSAIEEAISRTILDDLAYRSAIYCTACVNMKETMCTLDCSEIFCNSCCHFQNFTQIIQYLSGSNVSSMFNQISAFEPLKWYIVCGCGLFMNKQNEWKRYYMNFKHLECFHRFQALNVFRLSSIFFFYSAIAKDFQWPADQWIFNSEKWLLSLFFLLSLLLIIIKVYYWWSLLCGGVCGVRRKNESNEEIERTERRKHHLIHMRPDWRRTSFYYLYFWFWFHYFYSYWYISYTTYYILHTYVCWHECVCMCVYSIRFCRLSGAD